MDDVHPGCPGGGTETAADMQGSVLLGLDPLNFSLMSIPPAVHSLQPAGAWLHSIGQMHCDYMPCASVIKLSCYSHDTFRASMPAYWFWRHSPPHNCPLPQASCPSYYLSSITNATHMPRHTCTSIHIQTYTHRHACVSTHVHRYVRKRFEIQLFLRIYQTPLACDWSFFSVTLSSLCLISWFYGIIWGGRMERLVTEFILTRKNLRDKCNLMGLQRTRLHL